MAVEISGVTQCPSDDLITVAWLENPRTGPVEGYAVEVSGWVIGKAPVAEVQFVHEQSVVDSCELDVTRPDVAAVHGGSSQVGFSKAIETVGLATEFTIEVRVAFQDGRQDVIAEIHGTQQLTSLFTEAGDTDGAGDAGAAATTGKAGSEGDRRVIGPLERIAAGGMGGQADAPGTGATAAAGTDAGGAWGAGGEGTGGTAGADSTAGAGRTGGAGRRWRRRHRR